MSVLEKLTEGIVERSLRREGAALINKWARTGLLEGMGDDRDSNNMARLLENQAKELLREASTMEAGNVEGFASVAFPIVRRVFGGLLAQDIVSVQPMSLPSGLIFFLDFKHNADRLDSGTGSVYGGNVSGRQITGGVDQKYVSADDMASAQNASLDQGFYNLAGASSSPTGSSAALAANLTQHGAAIDLNAPTEDQKKMLRYDPDLLALGDGHTVIIAQCTVANIENGNLSLNKRLISSIDLDLSAGTYDSNKIRKWQQVRRLAALGSTTAHPTESGWDGSETQVFFVLVGQDANVAAGSDGTQLGAAVTCNYPAIDAFASGGDSTYGDQFAVVGTSAWGLENETGIPEINIAVDSIAVTAVTKKLKAKWTPELGQDLNAYHNLDAEVELTGILSEQIALEIDQEILNDLIQGATAGTMYWSRSPGLFVNKETGAELGASSAAPDFTGTVSEWYETLVETINDVSARIHRKTLRGGANFCVCGPEVANILEFTSGFRASVTADDNKGDIGAVNVGSLSKKFELYVDPYFPRNVVLVGRKGSSFLESGYVYAPYVPLQVTPTIFGEDDFTPRKGVMTRYAKQMVKPDMYGLVVVRGLLGEAGA
tara:strand:- start:2430 stop:4238 length:1809 start_codon:yes stop_codon:yes gene_type:complete